MTLCVLNQKQYIRYQLNNRGIAAKVLPGQEDFSFDSGPWAGPLNDLSVGETYPFCIFDFVKLRLPPLISYEETALYRQSRQPPPCPYFLFLLSYYV